MILTYKKVINALIPTHWFGLGSNVKRTQKIPIQIAHKRIKHKNQLKTSFLSKKITKMVKTAV